MQSIFTSWLDLFLVFVPVTIVLELLKADHLAVFISAGLAIIPLAGILGRATEHLTAHVGAGVGGLLNASLGNAFARFGHAFRNAFEVLVKIEYQAPWSARSTRARCN